MLEVNTAQVFTNLKRSFKKLKAQRQFKEKIQGPLKIKRSILFLFMFFLIYLL